MTWLVGSLLVLALLAGLPLASNADRAGLGQADLPLSLACPYASGGAGPFVETGIEVPLQTKDGAVLVTASVRIVLSPNAGFLIRPTIDGVAPDGALALHFIGEPQGETTTLSLSRAYAVDAGQHVFRLEFSCQGNVNASAGWLTVFQLR